MRGSARGSCPILSPDLVSRVAHSPSDSPMPSAPGVMVVAFSCRLAACYRSTARHARAIWPLPRLRPTRSSCAALSIGLESVFISAAAHGPRFIRDAHRARLPLPVPRDRTERHARPGPLAPPLRAEPLAESCRPRNSTSACPIAMVELPRELVLTAPGSFSTSMEFREWICRELPGKWLERELGSRPRPGHWSLV